ncbi:MAG TPA: hypothetical protein VJG30_00070 [Candidatus Nanoarchaeia archaeon]|nr:hypothetical protein [Candidatus Nanoarchaeia archaeon]
MENLCEPMLKIYFSEVQRMNNISVTPKEEFDNKYYKENWKELMNN